MRRTITLLVAVVAFGAACGSAPVAVTTSTTAVPTTTTTTLPPTPETARAAGLGWWNDRVFYEMFVRSFADSDGDGIGDLRGAIDRLDYLNDGNPATHDDLGVTGIWLMPVFESPSYHGYDVTDYRKVESDYGTNEDLKEFVAAAHRRGMAVILDLVINHTSVEHPWFAASASGEPDYADWYVWSEDDPGFSGPDGQQVWHRRGGRFYYALFWEGMPDLNLENPSVTAEITDVARFWIDEAAVDGYRLDAARHLVEDGAIQVDTPATLAWLERLRLALPADTLVLGEVWASAEIVAGYLPSALDLAFGFDLAAATVQGVAVADAGTVAASLDRVARLYPDGRIAVFLSNHDQQRVMSQFGVNPAKARMAATLLLTYPGVPFVYYGEEVGMSGRKPDPRLRTPMPWTGESPGLGFTTGEPWEEPQSGSATANVEDQSGDPDSLLSLYRDLIELRRDHPALRYGDTIVLETGSVWLLAYLRTIGDDHVLVVANLGIADVTEYGLTLEGGGPDGAVEAVGLIGAGDIVPLVPGEAGGFEGYRPLETLPGRTAVVIGFIGVGD